MKINDQSYDHQIEVNDRKMITSSTALGILRHQLARNIGVDRIKGFLIRFGWEMGENDAKQALKTGISLESLIEKGPIVHMMNGHIRGFTHECTAHFDDDHNIISLLGEGTWIDSYEAVEHVKRLGISDTQVCHTLIGYSSGFMSTICGQSVLAKEMTCVGKGDSECSWITRTQKEWESDMQEELHFYHETPIMEELEYTYEQLLEQQEFVTQLSDFQKKLTEEISNGSKLQTIANMVYDIAQIPILIEDVDHRMITYAGLSEEKYMNVKEEMDQYIQEEKEKHLLPFRKKTIKTMNHERLIMPILVQKEVLGYCSFLYDDIKNDKPEEDYLLLDRFANAASLILLNEKTKFESFERMKGSFLDQILGAQLPVNDIINRGKFAGLDLGKPYRIMVMEYKKTKASTLSIEEEFLLQEQILETTFRFFNEKKHPILVGQREGNIVLLMTKETNKNVAVYDVMKEFHDRMKQKYPKGEFKIGISNEADDIKNASKHYEEATIALRLTMRKKMVEFRSLGIVGVLINSKNMSGIKMIAQEELGSLYNLEDPKAIELLKTLYIYLLNGGKLEQTMSDLALSMSGLRHRIKRIESLLEKDLRDPNEMHQLLLIIKSLIALGELDID
ncbi:XylR N-terminal domain-containing protein [Bacillus sp. V3B]|nr:XylR N-terminal domain-containing protein [Bacillus sp. V3B]